MKVQEIMRSQVVSCSPDAPLDQVALSMWRNDCGAVPVIDREGRPVGIITDRDIAMGAAIQHKPLWEIRSEDITGNRPIYVCNQNENIVEALALMENHEIRRLPVVENNGKLAGMLSIGDVVNHTACNHRHHRGQVAEERAIRTLKAVMVHEAEIAPSEAAG